MGRCGPGHCSGGEMQPGEKQGARSVLIAGASGLVGGLCLEQLISEPRIGSIRAVTRRPLGLEELSPKVSEELVDFERLDLSSDRLRGDIVILAMGSTLKKAGSRSAFVRVDYNYQLEVARLARQNGSHSLLLVSSMGALSDSPFFYLRTKGELEDALRNLGYPVLSILRPSMLLGERDEVRLMELVGQRLGRLCSDLLPRRYRPVEAGAVARTLVREALREEPGVVVLESDAIRQRGRA